METTNLSLTGKYLISFHLGFAVLVKALQSYLVKAFAHGPRRTAQWPPRGLRSSFEKPCSRCSEMAVFAIVESICSCAVFCGLTLALRRGRFRPCLFICFVSSKCVTEYQ